MKEWLKKRRPLMAAVIAAGLFSSLSCKRPAPGEIEEKAGQLSFALRFRAVDELNYYREAPSSLAVCVYQLADRRAFDALRDGPEGMETLLGCGKFDDAVVGRERVFLDPGEKRKADFERRRGARYLALAAGYHNAGIAGSTLLIELPEITRRSGKKPPPVMDIVLERDRMVRDQSAK